MFFSAALCAARCKKRIVQPGDSCIETQRGFGWELLDPCDYFYCIPLLFNTYRSFYYAYGGLCSSLFFVINTFAYYFLLLSFLLYWVLVFFSADKEGFLKRSLKILLYPVFCIPDRLSAGIAVLQGFSQGAEGDGGRRNTKYKL